MIFWIRVWQFVSHHWCPTSWFSLPCFLTSNWSDFLHEPTLVCLVYMWIFLELFVAFPNCLRFSPLFDQNVDFVWHILPFHLGNSHILLDDHEILHVHTRHLELCIGVNPVHFSSVFILLWFFEDDTCFVDFFVHTWNCVDFLILIDYLPMIQLSWNFICMLCYGLWLSMNYFMIFGIDYVWVWAWSCCWPFVCSLLPCFDFFGL